MANTTWTCDRLLSPDEYNLVMQTAASFSEVLSRRTKEVPMRSGQVGVFGKIASTSLLVLSNVPSNS